VFASLLVANRGEIARRVIRTARRLGVRTVAVTTQADRSWPHWREADQAILIGEGPAAGSYLAIDRILAAARQAGAEAIHPGYGFLSENADFAEACAAAGLVFVGPPPEAIRAMGSKAQAKAIMARAGVPVVPGYAGERQDADFLKQKAYETGYPVLIKAVAGGGGRGMRRVDRVLDFEAALASAKREAQSAFADERVLIERFVAAPRHIEVQVFADAHGNVAHLFERDCSVQRRYQKVVEEAPAPGLPRDMREAIGEAAVKAAAAVGYRGAGTVEFIADASQGLSPDRFYFMEMNTRLQVEHPVTEAVTGLDLVEWQLRIAAGETLPRAQAEIVLAGHAVEARLYAEDPGAGFRPSAGRILRAAFPHGEGIRVDSGVEEGTVVGPFYDSLLAKIIAHGATRAEALDRLAGALRATRIAGPATNLALLSAIATHPDFLSGGVDTGFLDREVEALLEGRAEPGLAAGPLQVWLEEAAHRLASGAPGLWARTDSFELGGMKRVTGLPIEIDGEPTQAAVRFTAGGAEIEKVGDAAPLFQASDVVWDGRIAYILRGGKQLKLEICDGLAREPSEADLGGEVSAPMPGRIAVVAAEEGTVVARGDLLFTLEAMKMEHAVSAPRAGRVAAVRAKPGQQVEEGDIVVVIEPSDDAAK
jgi:3-methylcrotonyl-CoA carboxylase alpha subunit